MLDGGSNFKESKQTSDAPESNPSSLDRLQNGLEKLRLKLLFSDDYKDVSQSAATEMPKNNETSESQESKEAKKQESSSPTFKELFERLFSDDFLDGLKQQQENSENVNIDTNIDNSPIQNKQDGLRREAEVESELKEIYPPEDGYSIEQEVYIRDKDGNIVKDPVTGEARRIDFVVIKDGVVVDSIEVTSKTADKTEQSAKESRIREAGGNYIKDSDGNLIKIPSSVKTRIERRD